MCARTDEDPAAARRRELVARMRRLQEKKSPVHQQVESAVVNQDLLAVITAQYKRLVEAGYSRVDDFMQVPYVRVLSRSTQPAHVVMLAAMFLVSSLVFHQSSVQSVSPTTSIAYFASFSLHFGTQFWMTFVSGLALFFNLPRHDFAAVQKVLFPKYFSINSVLSLVTLISFTSIHHLSTIHTPETLQVVTLCVCFLLELCVRLYLVPPLLHLISVKTELEVAAGVGREVGQFAPGPLLACPHFQAVHKRFRRLHMTVAVANIASMGCTSLHLYYISYYWLCHTNIRDI